MKNPPAIIAKNQIPHKTINTRSRSSQTDTASYQSSDADYITISDSDDSLSDSQTAFYSNHHSNSLNDSENSDSDNSDNSEDSSTSDKHSTFSSSESELSSISDSNLSQSTFNSQPFAKNASNQPSILSHHHHQKSSRPPLQPLSHPQNRQNLAKPTPTQRHAHFLPPNENISRNDENSSAKPQNEKFHPSFQNQKQKTQKNQKNIRHSYPIVMPALPQRVNSFAFPPGIPQAPRHYYPQNVPYALPPSQIYGPQRHFRSQSAQVPSRIPSHLLQKQQQQQQPFMIPMMTPTIPQYRHPLQPGMVPGTSNPQSSAKASPTSPQNQPTTHYHISHYHYYAQPDQNPPPAWAGTPAAHSHSRTNQPVPTQPHASHRQSVTSHLFSTSDSSSSESLLVTSLHSVHYSKFHLLF